MIRTLFESITEYEELRGQMLTVIEGTHSGESMLRLDSQVLWEAGAFLPGHKNEITEQQDGITTIEGERIFCEHFGSQKQMVICGGGHVAQAILRLAHFLGFYVTVIDDRLSFADKAKREGADQVICDRFIEALDSIPGSRDTYFVVVTRGHRYDEECLKSICAKPFAYLGMMGSRRRTAMIRSKLASEGISETILEKLHAPIGLSIGAETPEEIAVSVLAEIIEVQHCKYKDGIFPREIWLELTRNDSIQAVLATIISRKGSTPRSVGTKMLILPDRRVIGTIGGGCAEAEVMQQALALLRSEDSTMLIEVSMTASEAEEEGMVCGGVMEVFLTKV